MRESPPLSLTEFGFGKKKNQIFLKSAEFEDDEVEKSKSHHQR